MTHLASPFTTTIEAAESMSSVRKKSSALMLTTVKVTQVILTLSLVRAQVQSQVKETPTTRYRTRIARRKALSIRTKQKTTNQLKGKSRWTKRKYVNVSRISNAFCFELPY